MERSKLFSRALWVSPVAVFAFVAACGNDDSGGASAAIRSFCAQYVSSAAFACCNAQDKQQGQFLVRYRYSSADECADALNNQQSASNGKQTFDSDAAQKCIAYLGSRQCGITESAAVRLAEEQAGCAGILAGTADENQTCNVSEDCKPGLVCPLLKETGLSYCAKPGGFNQDCLGEQAASVDHPACQQNLFCSFIGENPAGCPSPPCNQYKCVPPFDQGESCSGTECAPGLVCKDQTCQTGSLNGEGGSCVITDHCADGLYCDPTAGECKQRLAEGAPCKVANNPIFECKGLCVGAGDTGTCATFCSQ
jgi:hypothetical protein